MTENDITGDILDASIKLHRQFGAGLLESAYETLLEIELKKRGHKVERQKPVSFEYEGVLLENAFRLDMLVDDKVIVELKSTEKMSPVFAKQLKTYLAITKLHVGVVVNFGMATLKEGFLRFVNNYSDHNLCASPLLLWEQLSRASCVRFCPSAFRVAVPLQLIDAFLPMTLRLKQASCVSLLSAIRSLRRACTV